MIRRALIAAATLAMLAGCPAEPDPVFDVRLYSLTTAPPAATAKIINDDTPGMEVFRVDLTLGVALAARCWDSCTSACEATSVVATDPTILGVRPLWRPATTDDEVVLVASKVGTTTLRIDTACSVRDYLVAVTAP